MRKVEENRQNSHAPMSFQLDLDFPRALLPVTFNMATGFAVAVSIFAKITCQEGWVIHNVNSFSNKMYSGSMYTKLFGCTT